jgi:predicted ATPase
MPADLFVSYARKDREQVLPWVRQLQEAGVSLWLDERDIDAAHLWTTEIVEAIRACKVLLLMLSPASASSEHVVREVTFALEQHKPLLPAMLEPVELPSTLQYPLTGLQQIELFHGEAEAKRTALLRALARLGVAAPAWQTAAPPAESGEPRAASARPRHNLPQALTRFIGREREIATATEQLAHSRLLTLTGIGGLGKTRLALEVARAAAPDYLDGVWLVELAALTEPGLVPQQVAASLGLREELGRSLVETLTDYLQPRQLLLVLDNCEHLVAACAQLAQTLLQACPDLRLLATSREALGVPGEQLLRLPTLGAPVPPPPPVEELTRYEAVRLFIDRALLVQPSFAVTNANAPAVAEVCHCLDGIPLAIELAAARVKLLSPEQIMGRLEDRFRLLTGGSRTALPRQQTLRAAIDWSYDLLSEGERVLLRRLSVFAGGWSLEAAEAVCGGEGIAAAEVLDLLTQLADKSLLLVDEGEGAARYRLLETIRRYGAEKRASAGEEGVLRERHRDWYLVLAEEAEPELQGPRQGEWLARLAAEHENLRAALAWTSERGEGEAGLRLGAALSRFWMVRGYLTEGRARLATVLAGAGSEAGRTARAQALNGAGVLASNQGEYEAARALYEESLVIQRQIGDQRGIAISLNNLGNVASNQGEYEAARALYEESLAIRRELGDQQGIANSLGNLGNVAYCQGGYEAARALYEESLVIQREIGDQHGIARSFNGMGNVASDQGEYEAARGLYEESLAIQREIGDQQGIAYNLEGLAAVAAAQGQPGRAARLFGAGEALREAIGAPWPQSERAHYDRDVAAVRAALDEPTFAVAWAEGHALSLEAAIDLALLQPTPSAQP